MSVVTIIIEAVIAIVAIVVLNIASSNGQSPTIAKAAAEFNLLVGYADKFVAWAKQFQKDKTGSEKMDSVVEQLATVAMQYGIDVDEDQIKAIAQKAYDTMKSEEVQTLIKNVSGVTNKIPEVKTVLLNTSNTPDESVVMIDDAVKIVKEEE